VGSNLRPVRRRLRSGHLMLRDGAHHPTTGAWTASISATSAWLASINDVAR
jgi:hypothetical protein